MLIKGNPKHLGSSASQEVWKWKCADICKEKSDRSRKAVSQGRDTAPGLDAAGNQSSIQLLKD